jgi:hypothetical protein
MVNNQIYRTLALEQVTNINIYAINYCKNLLANISVNSLYQSPAFASNIIPKCFILDEKIIFPLFKETERESL